MGGGGSAKCWHREGWGLQYADNRWKRGEGGIVPPKSGWKYRALQKREVEELWWEGGVEGGRQGEGGAPLGSHYNIEQDHFLDGTQVFGWARSIFSNQSPVGHFVLICYFTNPHCLALVVQSYQVDKVLMWNERFSWIVIVWFLFYHNTPKADHKKP